MHGCSERSLPLPHPYDLYSRESHYKKYFRTIDIELHDSALHLHLQVKFFVQSLLFATGIDIHQDSVLHSRYRIV